MWKACALTALIGAAAAFGLPTIADARVGVWVGPNGNVAIRAGRPWYRGYGYRYPYYGGYSYGYSYPSYGYSNGYPSSGYSYGYSYPNYGYSYPPYGGGYYGGYYPNRGIYVGPRGGMVYGPWGGVRWR